MYYRSKINGCSQKMIPSENLLTLVSIDKGFECQAFNDNHEQIKIINLCSEAHKHIIKTLQNIMYFFRK